MQGKYSGRRRPRHRLASVTVRGPPGKKSIVALTATPQSPPRCQRERSRLTFPVACGARMGPCRLRANHKEPRPAVQKDRDCWPSGPQGRAQGRKRPGRKSGCLCRGGPRSWGGHYGLIRQGPERDGALNRSWQLSMTGPSSALCPGTLGAQATLRTSKRPRWGGQRP